MYLDRTNIIFDLNGTLLDVIKAKPFSFVPGMLQGLSVRNSLYIVSNCSKQYLEDFLETNSLKKYFKDYECSGRTGKLKSANIKMLTERNNLHDPVYVGDSESDKKAAEEAGVEFVYIENFLKS